MLKRLDSIEKADMAILDTEIAITEQVLRIEDAEARGRTSKTARSVLKTLYGLLFEYHRARVAMVESRDLTGRSGPGRTDMPAALASSTNDQSSMPRAPRT